MFLDLDPSLFETVLNWLRMFGVAGPTTDVPEAPVPAGKEEAFMVSMQQSAEAPAASLHG